MGRVKRRGMLGAKREKISGQWPRGYQGMGQESRAVTREGFFESTCKKTAQEPAKHPEGAVKPLDGPV